MPRRSIRTQAEFKHRRKTRSRRGHEAELFFALKSASSRRRLPLLELTPPDFSFSRRRNPLQEMVLMKVAASVPAVERRSPLAAAAHSNEADNSFVRR
jgi:hypothetical protein